VRNIPSLIHQQDVQLGLANFLMTSCAAKITIAFKESAKHFPASKTTWTGNPVRDLTPTTKSIVLDSGMPTVLIFGGGTGAQAINQLVTEQLCLSANVIHSTGTGKIAHPITHARYHSFEILQEEMKEALAKADVVVCRAGLGTITELAALKKPAIVIPMPDTHQEHNAKLLADARAAVVLDQRQLTAEKLSAAVVYLLNDHAKQGELSHNIAQFYRSDAAGRIAEIVSSLAT
jgi:UDP-N-acetylglucosamine--N-acetylmuramyl-(pentapeptide) pyrophosphoryl-undecaprenol N-acetylglucosamine transferase